MTALIKRAAAAVQDLGAGRDSRRTGAEPENGCSLVDVERGIVDPRVIILRALE